MSKIKISKLTKKQVALFPAWREKYLAKGLATGPIDRIDARRIINQIYEDGGLAPPRYVIFLDSPKAGMVGANLVKSVQRYEDLRDRVRNTVNGQGRDQVTRQIFKQVNEQVSDLVRERVGRLVSGQVGDQVRDEVNEQVFIHVNRQVLDQVSGQIDYQVNYEVRMQVSGQVRNQVSGQVRDTVNAQVYGQVGDQVRGQVSEQVSREERNLQLLWPACYGQHEAGWISFYTFFQDNTAVEFRKFDGLRSQLALGWCWLYQDIAIVTERPSLLRRDESNRLHSANGQAITYPDGWGFWCWHGVRVPREVIEAPETLTVEKIQSTLNIETRRVMIERYGQDRYIRDAGAVVLAMDEVGILYNLSQAGDEDFKMVRVLNGTKEPDGSHKEYMLRVPPSITTPKQGIAWTFGVATADYNPLIES